MSLCTYFEISSGFYFYLDSITYLKPQKLRLCVVHCRMIPLKMGPLAYPETSVHNHQSTVRNNTEEWSSHLKVPESWNHVGQFVISFKGTPKRAATENLSGCARNHCPLISLQLDTIECPFYHVPDHCSFIAYQACIGRDIQWNLPRTGTYTINVRPCIIWKYWATDRIVN